MKTQMKIATVNVADLTPAPYNPRKMTPRARKALDTSMERWGLVQPPVFNERTGNLVGGHQRREKLLSAGVTEVQCVIVDLDEREERLLNASLNNPHAQGRFTPDVADVLDGLLEQDALRDLAMDNLLPSSDDDASGSAGLGDVVRHRIIVECTDEKHQRELLARFDEEGLTCQALML